MKLVEALAAIRQRKETGGSRKLFLVCGFEPLHLPTFLRAHGSKRFAGEVPDVVTGLYGDLEGTLAAAANSDCEAAVVILEWADLDSRLGLRSTGGWGLSVQQDVLANCKDRFARLRQGVETLAARMPAVLVAPTLPIPLTGSSAGWQTDRNELELERQLASFLADVSQVMRVSVLNSVRLDYRSPLAARRDPLMELNAGFPYTLQHASVLASEAIQVLFPPVPMKGLITDLDGTLWSGIVGEVGASAVKWNLWDHAQVHGLYQQLLRHLSEMGVLLAIVSKNESAVVEEALRREDLCVPAAAFYPVCVNWEAKSGHVAEILRIWNVGADSVVFIDDSPMELGEVGRLFPSMQTRQFPSNPAQALALFEELRDLFGRPAVSREDQLRQASIRTGTLVQQAAASADGDQFVRSLEGRVTFDVRKNASNTRLLELINKTNQFNLNGIRLSEGEWMKHLEFPNSFVAGAGYEDRFGPLGTIGVMAGCQTGKGLLISSWVLSCRAFSRAIEHHMLAYALRQLNPASIGFAFRSTERNQPFRQFMESINVELPADGEVWLPAEKFASCLDNLPHSILVQNDV